jgi:hypothetical protein
MHSDVQKDVESFNKNASGAVQATVSVGPAVGG